MWNGVIRNRKAINIIIQISLSTIVQEFNLNTPKMDKTFLSAKEIINFSFHNKSNLVNKVIRKFYGHDLIRLPHYSEMVTIEQLNNIALLLNGVHRNNIIGDVVECGTFIGTTAVFISEIMKKNNANRLFHVYDNFEAKYHLKGFSPYEIFKERYKQYGLEMPITHIGDFKLTIPAELPASISFAHIDCGVGANKSLHKEIVLHCLNSVYSKMTQGAICVMMDYHDTENTINGFNSNPGVKLACDEFFSARNENMINLYGGYFSHGYFIKE